MGRQRGGARPLDLAPLLYGDRSRAEPGLVVPPPALASRRFVLAPLAELCPERIVPGTGATVAGLLAAAPPLDLRPVGGYPA